MVYLFLNLFFVGSINPKIMGERDSSNLKLGQHSWHSPQF